MRWVLLIVILVAAGVGAWMWMRRAGRPIGFKSYWDFARNRDRQQVAEDLFEYHKRIQERYAAMPTRELIDMLLGPDATRSVLKAITERGDRASAELVAALDRPEFFVRYPEKTASSMYFVSPAEAVLWCLEAHPVEAMASKAASLINHLDEDIAIRAACALASLASDSCLEPMTQILTRGNKQTRVQVYALMGLDRGLNAGRGSPEFRRRMFELIAPLAEMKSLEHARSIPDCLIKLDREQAISLLTSPACLSLAHRNTSCVIESLDMAGVLIDQDTLIRLIDQAEHKCIASRIMWVLCECLQALAKHRTPEARYVVQRFIEHSDKDVRKAASRSLLWLEGLEDPWGAAFAQFDDRTLDQLPPPVRHAILCRYFSIEVKNDDITQWFANGYGREWERTIEAFRAVGATNCADILSRCVRKLGDPVPPQGDAFENAVAEIHQRERKPWDSETDEFYADKDYFESKVLLYMLANREHFIPRPGRAVEADSAANG